MYCSNHNKYPIDVKIMQTYSLHIIQTNRTSKGFHSSYDHSHITPIKNNKSEAWCVSYSCVPNHGNSIYLSILCWPSFTNWCHLQINIGERIDKQKCSYRIHTSIGSLLESNFRVLIITLAQCFAKLEVWESSVGWKSATFLCYVTTMCKEDDNVNITLM